MSAPDLQDLVARAPTAQFGDMMMSRGVPEDISRRVAALDFGDRGKYEEAHLSCFGRLQHMQTAGRFVAELLQRRLDLARQPERDATALESHGGVMIPPLLTTGEATDARAFLLERPVFNGHTPDATADDIPRYVGRTASEFPFGSHRTADVAAAPHVLEAVLSDEMLALAASHLGCTPTVSNLQAWWNFPEHSSNEVKGGARSGYAPQRYHRDLNDFRMFWVYVYLTDVDEACGPHEVVKGSGDYETVERRLRASGSPMQANDLFCQYGYQLPPGAIDELFADSVLTVTGAAGASFLSNGFNFHRIRYPLQKRRLMVAARFSIYPAPPAPHVREPDSIPASLVTDRIGDSPTLRYVTRHVVGWA